MFGPGHARGFSFGGVRDTPPRCVARPGRASWARLDDPGPARGPAQAPAGEWLHTVARGLPARLQHIAVVFRDVCGLTLPHHLELFERS